MQISILKIEATPNFDSLCVDSSSTPNSISATTIENNTQQSSQSLVEVHSVNIEASLSDLILKFWFQCTNCHGTGENRYHWLEWNNLYLKGSVEGIRWNLACWLFLCPKMSLWFFCFKKPEKYRPKCTKIPPPLPLYPSPDIVGFRSLRTKTLCMCVFYAIGGEGGGLSRACLKPRFPTCGKKTDIFWHKKSQHAKFQRIPSNLNNCNEIGTYASLPRSPSFIR